MVTSSFLASWPLRWTEDLLTGLKDVDDWDDIDWANDDRFLKFKGWVMDNERKMEELLRTLVYYIDQDNTLATVSGGGRPERVR